MTMGDDIRRPRPRGVAILAVFCAFFLSPPSAAAGELVVPPAPSVRPTAYIVLPFHNRSRVDSLDWMEHGLAFVAAEKLETVAALRPAYGPLVISAHKGTAMSAQEVADSARAQGATWVLTGWFDRPNWKLQIGLELWRIDKSGVAARVAHQVGQGEFETWNELLGNSLVDALAEAKMSVSAAESTRLRRAPTDDFYAFTVFGRGYWGLLQAVRSRKAVLFERARKAFDRATLIDPKFAQAWRMGAELAHRQGREALAQSKLQRALALLPNYASALLASARSAATQGALPAAESMYRRVLAIRPWDLETRFRLGSLYWERGQGDEAYEQLAEVVKHSPRHLQARRILALIHSSRGELDRLVSELKAIAALDRKDTSVRLDLGAAYVAMNQPEKAIEAYQGVLDIDTANLQALKFLGDLNKKLGRVQHAIRYYGMALQSEPDDPRAYFLLGATYVEQGNDEAAKRIYLRAQRFTNFQAEAFNNLGAIAYRQRGLEQSLWYSRRAVLSAPNRAQYRYNYALSLSASGATKTALAQIDRGLELEPDHVELTYLRGVVLLRDGSAEEARAAFSKTLALEPGHHKARHNLTLLDAMRQRAEQGEVLLD